jgi:hypothetical protein
VNHDNYYIQDDDGEGIEWVEDQCRNCDNEISMDTDVYYGKYTAYTTWECEVCGRENIWEREYEYDNPDRERDFE